MSVIWYPTDLKTAAKVLLTGRLTPKAGNSFVEFFPRTHYGFTVGDVCLGLLWLGQESGASSAGDVLAPDILWRTSFNKRGDYDPAGFYSYRLYGCFSQDLVVAGYMFESLPRYPSLSWRVKAGFVGFGSSFRRRISF